LASCLDEPLRRAVGDAIPSLSGKAMHVEGGARALDLEALYLDVERRSNEPRSKAVEGVQVVLEVLATELPEELVLRLRKALHASIAERIAPRAGDEPEPPPHVHLHPPVAHPRPPTLSTGKPGWGHPLSESAPQVAHRDSVAASSDPHGATKVSSARGITQEQDDRTIASSSEPERR
jgi:hypothetical protein